MFTKSEALKHPEIVKSATETFVNFAAKANRLVSCRPWQHSITKSDTRTQHYFEITNEDDYAISELVKNVRLAFEAPLSRRQNEA